MSNTKRQNTTTRADLAALLQAARPAQWIKNGILFAAFIFGYGDKSLHVTWADGLRVFPAFMLFSMCTSAVYLWNDILDRKQDRLHPTKRHRPIAAGKLSIKLAATAAITLLLLALPLSALLSMPFTLVLLVYLGLQIVYTGLLKKVALLDVFVIASGFVLRAVAGAELLAIPISPWLLVCTFLLALFLALCKRRHEKASIEASAGARQRISLQKYDLMLTDQLISIVAGATTVVYAIYTLWPDTIEKFGSARLAFTIPIVMFGIFRYLDLLYRENKGDRPEQLLLSDIALLLTIFTYAATAVVLFTRF
ncbi:MAG: decaprenyl-phosphate phosphoribosyltransferase [Kiritimatiellia bacterium]